MGTPVPVGAPVGAPLCAPRYPGNGRAPPPAGGSGRGPAPRRGVGGAAELFLVLTVLTLRGEVPGGSSECGCDDAASPAPVPRCPTAAAAAAAQGAAVAERPRVTRLRDAGAVSRPPVGAPARWRAGTSGFPRCRRWFPAQPRSVPPPAPAAPGVFPGSPRRSRPRHAGGSRRPPDQLRAEAGAVRDQGCK